MTMPGEVERSKDEVGEEATWCQHSQQGPVQFYFQIARPTTQWLRGFRARLSLPTPRSRTSQCNGKDMNENIQEKEVCLMLHYMLPTGDDSTTKPRQDAKCRIKVNATIMREFASTKHLYAR